MAEKSNINNASLYGSLIPSAEYGGGVRTGGLDTGGLRTGSRLSGPHATRRLPGRVIGDAAATEDDSQLIVSKSKHVTGKNRVFPHYHSYPFKGIVVSQTEITVLKGNAWGFLGINPSIDQVLEFPQQKLTVTGSFGSIWCKFDLDTADHLGQSLIVITEPGPVDKDVYIEMWRQPIGSVDTHVQSVPAVGSSGAGYSGNTFYRKILDYSQSNGRLVISKQYIKENFCVNEYYATLGRES